MMTTPYAASTKRKSIDLREDGFHSLDEEEKVDKDGKEKKGQINRVNSTYTSKCAPY
jgi:hypothetical protein